MRVIKKTYEQNSLILHFMPDEYESNQVLVSLYGENLMDCKQYYGIKRGFEVRITNEELYSKLIKIMIKSGNEVCYFNRFRIPPKIKHRTYDENMNRELEVTTKWNMNTSIMVEDLSFDHNLIAKHALQLLK